MNRNQKIALGCGIAGCLGLILIVIIIVVLGVLGYIAMPGASNRNENFNSSSNSNSDTNENTNSASSSDLNSNTNSDSSSTSSSMSADDKHKLFQAAGMTKDEALIKRVMRKIGLMTESGGVASDYQDFLQEHPSWALRNSDFVRSVITPEAARTYVEEHIDD